jgi:imidazolonepropionase-like amidohydrolase
MTEECPEKYGKRLVGKTAMEDALKRLDRLTQEEGRMAIAENLLATHAVDEGVRAVDDRVANVNDRVAEVIHGVKISVSPEKHLLT